MGPDFDENDYHRYRCYTIHCLPNIKFLDSTPVTKAEKEESKLRGKFLKVVKPALSEMDLIIDGGCENPCKMQLPSKSSTPRGIYGACRYRYTGKNSEGNRFIRNNDL